MDIKCKYSLGDTVYYMKDNRVRSGFVKEINLRAYLEWDGSNLPINRIKINVTYDTEDTKGLAETKVFNSKEELLKSL